ncbi:hypothetical protein PENSPDRAFT_550242, partial [Peniophora sp. CONT]
IAVEMATRVIEMRSMHDVRVLIRGDNQGVQKAYEKGSAKSWYMNQCIRRITQYSMRHNVFFDIEYVRSEDNISDPVPHDKPPSEMTR